MQSPFGDVSGLQVSGIVQRGAVETVKLAIQLKCDSGLNSINAMLKPGGRSSVNWKGAGTLDYIVPAKNVEISVGYVHSKLDTQKLNLSIVIHFNPHGWVRLVDTQLRLEGHQYPVSFVIPHDVEKVKTRFFWWFLQNALKKNLSPLFFLNNRKDSWKRPSFLGLPLTLRRRTENACPTNVEIS